MTLIRFDDLNAIPWKNGLGITREVAVHPHDAGMDDFLWRVSIADVDTASPFSVFPGVDRTIVLLQGDGFTMTLDGAREHALTEPCVPFSFPGEASVAVRLAGGATRDFNLMVRRKGGTARLEVWQGPLRHEAADDIALMHLARGEARVGGESLHTGDTVRGPHEVELLPDAVLLVVRR
ncbi:HutD/Ves family protein [Luteibacter sahnii]|uniref:HutD/Ves family protein n=1 Tax=Luteibacter sahnii TaxID=3021977 RepID=UPI002A69D8A8|nr:HutD family protein [Luteibacter sp. PPL193]MDY1549105.1 HutD family protein [Luteibacter sp. PPL193]